MSKVAIVGSGFVGRAWAISFARAGHEVALWDADPSAPAKALTFIEGVLPDLVANDLAGGVSAADLRARMKPVADLREALDGAVHVQENTPEDVGVKREIFGRLDELAGARRRARKLHLGDPAVGVHGKSSRPRALSGRASDQSALSGPRRRSRARALDGGERGRANRRVPSRRRTRADRDEARTGRVRDEPASGRLARRGVPSRGRRLRRRRGRRCRHSRGAGAALEFHGAVRDHRSQRARRRARLRAALSADLRTTLSLDAEARRLDGTGGGDGRNRASASARQATNSSNGRRGAIDG